MRSSLASVLLLALLACTSSPVGKPCASSTDCAEFSCVEGVCVSEGEGDEDEGGEGEGDEGEGEGDEGEGDVGEGEGEGDASEGEGEGDVGEGEGELLPPEQCGADDCASVRSRANFGATRSVHLVALPDGRFVAVGGESSRAVRLYDPIDDVWRQQESLRESKSTFCDVSFGGDGDIYVVGQGFTADAYSVDGEGLARRTLIDVPLDLSGVAILTTTDVDGGVFFVVQSRTILQAFRYAGVNWTDIGRESVAHDPDGFVTLPDGDLFLIGGNTTDGTPTALVDRYDLDTEAWVSAPPLPSARTDFASVVLADGRVLVAGGRDSGGNIVASAFVFDGERWTSEAMTTSRTRGTALALPSGEGVVVGGSSVDGAGGQNGVVEVYSPSEARFFSAGTIFARSDFGAAASADRVLTVGGISGSTRFDTVEEITFGP